MPSRNVIREFETDAFYHMYNRGVEKRAIFLDEQDYAVFLNMLKKYLTGDADTTNNRHKFLILSEQLDLLAFCLMPNHFHLLVYQRDKNAITRLMQRVITGYVMYFNERYKRVGALFQGRYKASHINADAYLHHISRYIHMNPENYSTWPYSSLIYYSSQKSTPKWLKTDSILELFNNSNEEYMEFIRNYHETKSELSVLKWQLANDIDDEN